jgi:hypothetical protein
MGSTGRLRSSFLATVGVGLLAAVAAAPVAIAATPLALPTFIAGPLLSGGTLIWQDSAGLEALSPGGAPRSLLRGGTLAEVSTGGGWIALGIDRAVMAGPADGRLAKVKLPQGCEPLAAETTSTKGNGSSRALLAISGRRLFDVVGPSCRVGGRSGSGAFRLVAFDSDGHYAGLLRRLTRRPLAVSAAGKTVAIVSATARQSSYTIAVIRPGGAHVTTFDTLGISPQVTTDVQTDNAGDVFANVLASGGPGPPGEYDDTSGFVVPDGCRPFEPDIHVTITPRSGPVPETAVSMSDGKLAFLGSTEQIEVLDVAAGAPVATVDIASGNEVLGLALDGTELAWIEQPVAYELWPPEASHPTTGPTCSYVREPTGPPSIEYENLAEIGTALVTVGTSPAPVKCTRRPAPP